jgi:hypothetical protein
MRGAVAEENASTQRKKRVGLRWWPLILHRGKLAICRQRIFTIGDCFDHQIDQYVSQRSPYLADILGNDESERRSSSKDVKCNENSGLGRAQPGVLMR